jgi:hypothetical protein
VHRACLDVTESERLAGEVLFEGTVVADGDGPSDVVGCLGPEFGTDSPRFDDPDRPEPAEQVPTIVETTTGDFRRLWLQLPGSELEFAVGDPVRVALRLADAPYGTNTRQLVVKLDGETVVAKATGGNPPDPEVGTTARGEELCLRRPEYCGYATHQQIVTFDGKSSVLSGGVTSMIGDPHFAGTDYAETVDYSGGCDSTGAYFGFAVFR